MELKPIEPGCLAMVIGTHPDAGKVVGVIKRITPEELFKTESFTRNDQHDCLWEVDTELEWHNHGIVPVKFPGAPEFALMRVDGFDEDEDERDEELVHVKENCND